MNSNRHQCLCNLRAIFGGVWEHGFSRTKSFTDKRKKVSRVSGSPSLLCVQIELALIATAAALAALTAAAFLTTLLATALLAALLLIALHDRRPDDHHLAVHPGSSYP